jgi:hypothetical protein
MHKKSLKLGGGQNTPAQGGQFILAEWSKCSGIGVVNQNRREGVSLSVFS